MKAVKMFYLQNCPHCKKAMAIIEALKADRPELQAVDIEMIEETEHPEIADTYDYYYVPTLFVGDVKMHEGIPTEETIERALLEALN